METSDPLNKPKMVYDGECDFCRRWIRRWRRATGDRVDYVPYQDAADEHPEIPIESFQRAIHLIEPNGRVWAGAHAIFRALSIGSNRHWPLRAYEHLPGIAPLTETGYRLVARNRRVLSFLTRCLYGADTAPISHRSDRR